MTYKGVNREELSFSQEELKQIVERSAKHKDNLTLQEVVEIGEVAQCDPANLEYHARKIVTERNLTERETSLARRVVGGLAQKIKDHLIIYTASLSTALLGSSYWLWSTPTAEIPIAGSLTAAVAIASNPSPSKIITIETEQGSIFERQTNSFQEEVYIVTGTTGDGKSAIVYIKPNLVNGENRIYNNVELAHLVGAIGPGTKIEIPTPDESKFVWYVRAEDVKRPK